MLLYPGIHTRNTLCYEYLILVFNLIYLVKTIHIWRRRRVTLARHTFHLWTVSSTIHQQVHKWRVNLDFQGWVIDGWFLEQEAVRARGTVFFELNQYFPIFVTVWAFLLCKSKQNCFLLQRILDGAFWSYICSLY